MARSATPSVTLYVPAAAKVCDGLAVAATGVPSPKFQRYVPMASPTSWSVLVLVKVQARSTQATAKFAVGAVLAVPAPAGRTTAAAAAAACRQPQSRQHARR